MEPQMNTDGHSLKLCGLHHLCLSVFIWGFSFSEPRAADAFAGD